MVRRRQRERTELTGWEWRRLKFFVRFLDHKRVPLSAEERSYLDKVYPYYGASGIIDAVDRYLFDEDTILLGEDGANLLARSSPLAFMATGKYWVNNHAHILKPRTGDIRFWAHRLESEDYAPFVTGSAQPKLTMEALGNVWVSAPSPERQRVVADYVERRVAPIDELISKKEELVGLLQEKRNALIAHAITKGLDSTATLRDSSVEWIGMTPAHWRLERAKAMFRESKLRSVTGEEELLTISHITGVTPRSEKTVYMFEAETLEGYKVMRPGNLGINTMWAWMGALGISPCEGIVSPSYNVYEALDPRGVWYYDYLFRTPAFIAEIVRWSKGVWKSRLRLYPTEFSQIVIPIPPAGEREAIVEYLRTVLARDDRVVEKTKLSVEKLRAYRRAVIAAAVTGEPHVSDVP